MSPHVEMLLPPGSMMQQLCQDVRGQNYLNEATCLKLAAWTSHMVMASCLLLNVRNAQMSHQKTEHHPTPVHMLRNGFAVPTTNHCWTWCATNSIKAKFVTQSSTQSKVEEDQT